MTDWYDQYFSFPENHVKKKKKRNYSNGLEGLTSNIWLALGFRDSPNFPNRDGRGEIWNENDKENYT